MEIREYQTADGRMPFSEWLGGLRDGEVRARIVARLDRIKAGLLGDWKSVGGGVYELRVKQGPGYRVYYGQEERTVILLLCGGDKRSQTRDIERAHDYWKDYQTRRAKPRIQLGKAPAKSD